MAEIETIMPVNRSSNIRLTFLFIQWALLIGISVLTASYFGLDLNPKIIAHLVSYGILALFIWSLWSWKRIGGSFFDPYTLFLTAATLFNGGSAFVFLIRHNQGYALTGGLFRIYDVMALDTVVESWLLVLLGLAAFHFGALFCAVVTVGKRQSLYDNQGARLYTMDMQRLRQIGWGMFLVSLIPNILVVQNAIQIVLSSGYSSGWAEQAFGGGILGILKSLFVPGIIFIIAGSKQKPVTLSIATASLIIYIVAYFFIGARRLAVMPLIAVAWVWDRCIYRFPRSLLVSGGLIVLLIILPMIRFTRQTPGEERLNFSYFWRQYSAIENPAVEIVAEMGESVLVPLTHTLELVPEFRPFDLGASYLSSLTSLFPNLGEGAHPAAARNLSQWLVNTVDPSFASRGGGYGFSFISEAYLNFGWLGTPLVLILLGFLYARFVLWAVYSSSPLRTALLASFLSFFLLFARGESYLLPRQLIWYGFLPYLLVRIVPPIRFLYSKRVSKPEYTQAV